MSLILHSITKEELINSGTTMQCHFSEGIYILMKINHPMTATYQNSKVRLKAGSILWGRNFMLENSSENITHITSIKFKTTTIPNFSFPPFVITASVPFVMTKIFHLIADCECSCDLMNQINQLTDDIEAELHTLSLEQTNTNNGDNISPDQDYMLEGEIDQRLIKIYRYIRGNFHKPLTLQDLADLIYCNPVYLSNMYTRVFNKSPIKHIQSLRMNEAKKMLTNTNLSISEITKKLGYTSSSQFSSLFRKHFNISPTKYRSTYHFNKYKEELR